MNLKTKTWFNVHHYTTKTPTEKRAISLRFQQLGAEKMPMKKLWDLDLAHRMTDEDLEKFSREMREDFDDLFKHRGLVFDKSPEGIVKQCYEALGVSIRLERCRDRDQKQRMWYLFTEK